MHALSERGLVNYTPYDLITLTAKGEKIAKDVVRRHEVLCDFFIRVLSVNETDAEDAACKIEHAASPAVMDRFVQFIEFIDSCPRGGEDWLQAFAERCKHGEQREDCDACISRALKSVKKKD